MFSPTTATRNDDDDDNDNDDDDRMKNKGIATMWTRRCEVGIASGFVLQLLTPLADVFFMQITIFCD